MEKFRKINCDLRYFLVENALDGKTNWSDD